MQSALKLTATAALGAFYLAIAYAAMRPNTTAEYRDHYLQRVSGCWLPDALRAAGPELPAVVNVGELSYPAACLYLQYRWREAEPWGAWSFDGDATLRVPWRPDADAVELLIRAPDFAPGPIMSLFVLGTTRLEVALSPGERRSVTLALPPREAHDPWTVIVRSQEGGSAATGNPSFPRQRVGLGLIRIRYLGSK